MSPVEAACPTCGAPVVFEIGSSIVKICEQCQTVIARGDRDLESLGKVAALVDTDSPLAIGLDGHFRDRPFELVGRVQYRHQAGGVWNEWYAAFRGDRWGWLAEAAGRFYLTFEKSAAKLAGKLPAMDTLELGRKFTAPGLGTLQVAELGVAQVISAEGEIPFRVEPGQDLRYADLAGRDGVFATLDYSDDPPRAYLGREVTLAELGLDNAAPADEEQARTIEGLQVSCPKCGGSLDLRAPDETLRVACPFCGALLDCDHGNLKFLKALQKPKIKLTLPLGAKGTLFGVEYVIIGSLRRYVRFDGVKYYWQEYLIYAPKLGFRWLVFSDDHWSFVEAVSPGEIDDEGTVVRYGGDKFKLFQRADAVVDHVLGEFTWKVEVNETVEAVDYIAPPLMLSKEVSISGAEVMRALRSKQPGREKALAGEVNWSKGTYLEPQEIEAAFGVSGLPRSWKVAPNQPFRYKSIYTTWAVLVGIAGLLFWAQSMTSGRRTLLEQSFPLEATIDAAPQTFFVPDLELGAWRNTRVTAQASFLDNSWADVEGDLHQDSSGLLQSFYVPLSYYHGVDSGEAWSEGSRRGSAYLRRMPPGKYTMRLEVTREKPTSGGTLELTVEQGVPRWSRFWALIGLLTVPAILTGLWNISFDMRRWSDSDYNPYEGWTSGWESDDD